jgi:hypothetical protein
MRFAQWFPVSLNLICVLVALMLSPRMAGAGQNDAEHLPSPVPPDAVLARVNGIQITQRLFDLYRDETFSGLLLPDSKRDLAGLEDLLLLAREAERRGIDREPLTMARLGHAKRGIANTALQKSAEQAAEPVARAAYPRIAADPANQLVRLRMIAARSPAESEQLALALAAGASFEDLAAAHLPKHCALLRDTLAGLGSTFPCLDNAGDLGFGRFAPAFSAGYLRDVAVWPEAIEPAVANLAPGEVTAPVKVGEGWVLLRVEQRRPVSLDEVLPALRRSIASDMVLQMLAKLPRVPFEPAIPDAPDFVLGRIGGVAVTAYDVFNLSDDSNAFQPWHIPDAIEIVPWSGPIAADSVQAQDFINAYAILAKAGSVGLLDQPPTRDRWSLLRAAILTNALAWHLVDDGIASGALPSVATIVILARDLSTDTAQHAAVLSAGLKGGRDPATLGIPVAPCGAAEGHCLLDGRTVFYVARNPAPDTPRFPAALVSLPVGAVSEPVPVARTTPMTANEGARLPHPNAGGAQRENTGIDHAFDVGMVLARAERRMVTNDGAGFDYAKTAVNALRDRLRAGAVIEAVADPFIPAPPPTTPAPSKVKRRRRRVHANLPPVTAAP